MLNPLVGVLSSVAFAAGPWTLAAGDHSVWLGLESRSFQTFASAGGSELDLGGAVAAFTAKGFVTVGLQRGIDLELGVPWTSAAVAVPNSEGCQSLGGDRCRPTQGLGVISARTRWQVLDELSGAPMSLSLVTEVRFGTLTLAERGRITNLGEGSTDVGPIVSVGRTGGVGAGWWSAFADVGYRHRIPLGNIDGRAVPGDELHSTIDLQVGGKRKISVGPAASFLYRPSGVDLADADPSRDDWLASLSVMQLQAGGRVVVRTRESASGSVYVLRTVASENNPLDTLVIGGGLTVHAPFARLTQATTGGADAAAR